MPAVSVLVVDDHESLRSLLSTILTAAGYSVSTAADGGEALELVAQHPPALILMDLMMPGMDGREAVRQLRAEPATRGVPVIAVTAEDHRRSGALLREAGFNAYLPKPFGVHQVPAAVERCLAAAAAGETWTELPPSDPPRRRTR